MILFGNLIDIPSRMWEMVKDGHTTVSIGQYWAIVSELMYASA